MNQTKHRKTAAPERTRVLREQQHADDLTQETYLRAFRGLPGFAGRSSAQTCF